MAPKKKRKSNDDKYIDAIDDYSGKDDFQWLNRTETLCELQRSDIMKILPLKRKGDAFTVYARLATIDRTSYRVGAEEHCVCARCPWGV